MTIDPIQRRQYGLFALLLSIVFLAIATGAGVTNAIRRASVAKEIENADQDCQNRLGTLGAKSPVVTSTSITATWPGTEGGWSALSAGSSAAQSCPGWTMKTFCAGQGCSKPGVTITMGRSGS